ncbi:hypothetical protein HID58_077582 [Brassica napus]|uniref:Uncharacterized protein n=1 Tax=Brassica napus TaxID=3708 RepID=A0ABQ7YQS1_BRANA|nr:hypothetical protein HID58_077582 [Brassica napus]
MAYIMVQADPHNLLKLIGSNRGKDAEMTFVKTGRRHQNAFLTGYELHSFNIVLCLITFL